ncbi:uncharacterized protein METZ01_LOCUS359156, partial [marine metagenome]
TVAETEQTDLLEVTGTPTLAAGATLKDKLDNSPNDMEDFTIPGAGNISESSTIKIDGIRPFVQSVEYNDASLADTFRLGQPLGILVTFSEPVELGGGGNLLVDLETGTPDGRVTISTIPESPDPDNNPLTVLGTYTVGVGELIKVLTVKEISLSAGSLEDASGNDFDGDYSFIDDIDADGSAIVIDGVVPSAFTITSVTTDGGNSETSDGVTYDDIWNSTNTSAIVRVPLEGEVVGHNTLVKGTIQVQGKITGSFEPIGSVHTITGTEATAQEAEITISGTDILALPGFGNGESIIFTAIITDFAGNSTTGSA